MIRFLHTADWQLGMKARHVAEVGDKVRAARLQTVRRLLQVAAEQQADFVIVAGDTFEDNQVDSQLVHKLLSILEQCPLPIYILPGNHDPLTADSVYLRSVLVNNLPANVHILRTFEPLEPLPGVILLPAPCCQKKSDSDPTLRWPLVSSPAVKIGVAHGSLMIEGRYQPDDFPIALAAAERQGLDYLALGHWHSLFSLGKRTFYSGTPEPTGFDEPGSGSVLLVTIDQLGQIPQVEPIKVNTLSWQRWEYDLGAGIEGIAGRLKHRIGELDKPETALVRLALAGHLSLADSTKLNELTGWLRARLFHLELDTSRLLTQPLTAKLLNMARSQPFLQALLADLKVTAAILGEPLSDLPEDLVAGAGPSQELLATIIEEGFQPEDAREAVRTLAALMEEV